MSAISPSRVVYTLRQLKRNQMRTTDMDAAAVKYITDNELVKQTNWPATVINITEAGYEYIADNEASA